QMLFDANLTWNHQEWAADKTLERLMAQGVVKDTIIVGIDNDKVFRIPEYAPDDISEFLAPGDPVYIGLPSMGNAYLKFIVTELKPFIDSHYSTYTDAEHTFIMGSSCGALISLYALCKYPDVFGGAGCLSTHTSFESPGKSKQKDSSVKAFLDYLKAYLPKANTKFIYMDRGSRGTDASYASSQKKITDCIRSLGWDSVHFQYRFFRGASHCESDWASRLDIPFSFLLRK
ncbi:MAG: alpha/beta hydrolase, partial [Candidatus Cryptobacteroides sp.]